MAKLANTTMRTIENWRRTKASLVKVMEDFISYNDIEDMELEVTIKDVNNLVIKNRKSGTIYITQHKKELSYFKNVLSATGYKYGVIDFVTKEECDLFTLAPIFKKN